MTVSGRHFLSFKLLMIFFFHSLCYGDFISSTSSVNFITNASDHPKTWMSISTSGVGIGIDTPSANFHIKGDFILSSGNATLHQMTFNHHIVKKVHADRSVNSPITFSMPSGSDNNLSLPASPFDGQYIRVRHISSIFKTNIYDGSDLISSLQDSGHTNIELIYVMGNWKILKT
jgi:hypothetical protein